jgi:hypothetical protein
MKKRFFSLIPVPDANNMPDVIDWLRNVHRKDLMHTTHFENVLIFPTDGKNEVLIISIAKSVEHANAYEADEVNGRPEMKRRFKKDMIDTGLVGTPTGWTSTEAPDPEDEMHMDTVHTLAQSVRIP